MHFTLSQDTEKYNIWKYKYLETIRRIYTVMGQNDMLKISRKSVDFDIVCYYLYQR